VTIAADLLDTEAPLEQRFLLSPLQDEVEGPGLILQLDGSVWLELANGDRVELAGGQLPDGWSQSGDNLDAGGNRLVNLGDPVDDQDAVTKAWALSHGGSGFTGWTQDDSDPANVTATGATLMLGRIEANGVGEVPIVAQGDDDSLDSVRALDAESNVVAALKPSGIYAKPTAEGADALYLDASVSGGNVINTTSGFSIDVEGHVVVSPSAGDAPGLTIHAVDLDGWPALSVEAGGDYPVFNVSDQGQAQITMATDVVALTISSTISLDSARLEIYDHLGDLLFQVGSLGQTRIHPTTDLTPLALQGGYDGGIEPLFFVAAWNGASLFSIGPGGELIANNVPTSDPHVAGQVYALAGALMLSAG
jgi:hypothetical protein